ncbi:MAG: 6-carboxytetrahydropterin synthase [Myxococcales bacterium]|nr:6-carboxytetrahydropterin synthase [Myxococcales bacterium]
MGTGRAYGGTISRRLEFDAAHRVTRHESKCSHLHGHRYIAHVHVRPADGRLDAVDRVIDFGAIKAKVGAWIDLRWDHGALLNRADTVTLPGGGTMAFSDFVAAQGWKVYVIDGEPTAEVLAAELLRVAGELLAPDGIVVDHIELFETPNCAARVYSEP